MHTEDGKTRSSEIIGRAYRTLRPLLLTEQAFEASVSAITRRTIRFTRARFVVEHRAIVRRSEPAHDMHSAQVEPLITPELDPWTVELEQLPSATRQLCACPSCGDSPVERCGPCQRTGRVYTWLEVQRTPRVAVRATPTAVAGHWLPRALDESDFLSERWLHRLEREDVLSPDRVGELPQELLPALGTDDRITQACAQSFVVQAFDVRYQTAFGTGVIELAGSPLQVFDVVRTPLRRRSIVARGAAAAGASISLFAALAYREQHPWFAKYGPDGTALLIGLLASLLLGTALLGWLRARPSRTALSTWCPTAGALALTVLCTALLSSAQPSIADARDALQKKDLARATLTADALSALGRSVGDNQRLRDDIRLARMAAAPSLARKLSLAASGPWSSSRHSAMRSAVLQAVEPLAERARRAGDAAQLQQLAGQIAGVLPSASHALAVEAAALTNRACLARADLVCIERSAGELGRLGAIGLRDRSRQALIAMLQQRYERAIEAVAHSRTVRVELAHLSEASALSQKLATLDAPLRRSQTLMLERGRARAEAEVRRVDAQR